MSVPKQFKLLWDILDAYRLPALVTLVLVVLGAVVESFGLALLLPLLDLIAGSRTHGRWSTLILDRVTAWTGPGHLLLGVAAVFLVFLFLKATILIIRCYSEQQLAHGLRSHWIEVIHRNYLHAQYAEILRHKQGVLLHNTLLEPAQACKAILYIVDFIARIFLVSGLYIVLFMTSWKITLLLTLSAGILIVLTNKATRNYSLHFGKERMLREQEINGMISETMAATRQVKTFGLEDFLQHHLHDRLRTVRELQVKNSVITELPSHVAQFFIGTAAIGVLLYLEYVRHYPLKEIVSVMGLFTVVSQRISSTLSELYSGRMRIISLAPSLGLIRSRFKEAKNQEILDRGNPIDRLEGDIRFENVSFAYDNKAEVLRHFNLIIRRGQMTALIGPSGVGKSTLADLLLGLYRPQEGHIWVGNQELSVIRLSSWRRLIGFVSQDIFIFNTTIRENIGFGKSGATEKEIVSAAQAACAHDFILSLPHGYDTVVGDRGLRLSGGQRQRIALARALIRDPEVFIFDEATSALDQETELAVKESIDRLSGKKTILLIAHRLSTIENADAVYDFSTQELRSVTKESTL